MTLLSFASNSERYLTQTPCNASNVNEVLSIVFFFFSSDEVVSVEIIFSFNSCSDGSLDVFLIIGVGCC